MYNIAIVGAGIFGTTSAIRLAGKGHKCTIYEKKDSILSCASRVNQYRFHRGYHYPRTVETVKQLNKTSKRFQEEYGEAINFDLTNIYALAKEKSLVNLDQYIDFLEVNSLSYKILDSHLSLKRDMFSAIFEVQEGLINFSIIKKIIGERINKCKNLNIKLNTTFHKQFSDKYDFVIICTYGFSSNLLPYEMKKKYKFQLIEKPVVKPHKSLNNQSIVIVDGPFMCIDPLLGTSYSVLGNVKHAVYQSSCGYEPESIPSTVDITPWEDIKKSSKSRFQMFIDHGKEYIKNFEKCEFKYSMSGYRVINPNREKTDDRPTYINNCGKFFEISSGKIDTCSWTADHLAKLIDEKN
tara:strand:- start:173 stop:1228 length:1056 start_codon:yes stop_codon:yes gene_type:complete